MDIAYESVLAGGWETWLDAWIWTCLPIVALPLVVVIALAAVVVTTEPRTLFQRFWCALYRREAEVPFASRGLLPVPRAVLSCSVFEPGDAVACRRRCLDASYRRQWAPPLAARDGEEA
jgi:hypothetical protein